MAFKTNLIAISWVGGRYEVVSQIQAKIDTPAINEAKLFNNVSSNLSYLDEAAILEKNDFANYISPQTHPWHIDAFNWYASLPVEVHFIMVHRAEWESGLDD